MTSCNNGLPKRSDQQNILVTPIIEVKRRNWFMGLKRCCKIKVVASVAVAYLLLIGVTYNYLLLQQVKRSVEVSVTEVDIYSVRKATSVNGSAAKGTEEVLKAVTEVIATNSSNLESNLPNYVTNTSKATTAAPGGKISSYQLSAEQIRFLYLAYPNSFGPPNYCVHIFYYPWYGTPTHDGQYYHWNHRYLPHWHHAVTSRYPKGRHNPPDDIGASFYPQLGCYSSRDHWIIEMHMKMLRQAGVGVLAVSWYPPGKHDDEGRPLDEVIPLLLDMAMKYTLKIALHLEPYENRTANSVYDDIKYINSKYRTHPAFYKISPRANNLIELPIVYIYNSYQLSPSDWAQLFTTNGPLSLRNTNNDVVAIGLLTSDSDKMDIVKSGFDGFYTYFAIDGFTYASTSRNWYKLSQFANKNNLLFIPSAGPGYDDTMVRPWNSPNTKSRNGGQYYREKMTTAIRARTRFISVTSFNEWHEGTQIEPAIPAGVTGVTYQDYRPHRPDYYLDHTRRLLQAFKCKISP